VACKADADAAQFTADQQALRAEHRHAAQQLQECADGEFSLGDGARTRGADDFDAGPGAGGEIDVLDAGRQAADRAQEWRCLQHRVVDGDGRGRDDRTHLEQRLAKCQRFTCELRRDPNPVARLEPLHHFGFEWLDDQQIHLSGDVEFSDGLLAGLRATMVADSFVMPFYVRACTSRRQYSR